MTKAILRIIIALAIVCAGALIVAVHLAGEDNYSGTENVTPEGSPMESDPPGDMNRNVTPEQAPGEAQETKNMTSKEIMERAQEIYAAWHRSQTVERVLKGSNITPDELPDGVIEELKTTVQFEDIIRTWDVDPRNKQIVIYASPALNEEHEKELSAVQGRQVGDWTFNVVWEPYVPSFVREALDAANMTLDELPDEGTEEMEKIGQTGGIRKWELDPRNNRVIVYTYFSRDAKHEQEVQAVQGKQVAGWTFNVVHDLEDEKTYEKDLERLAAELVQFKKDHPELQISSFATSPTQIDMWVRSLTPENEALNGTVMHNRIVLIQWSPVDYAIRMAREEAGW